MFDGDTIDDLMREDDDALIPRDSEEEAGIDPIIDLDIDEVNTKTSEQAKMITERLSNYYFDEKYINEHPYIPTKIMMEMENIRRLLKMLMVNESAQDALIKAIVLNSSKGTLYLSLTAMQKATLMIQKQLNDLVTSIEQIFQKMQDETEKAWMEKDKVEGDDGTITVRGSKEFIQKLMRLREEGKNNKDNSKKDNANNEDDAENEDIIMVDKKTGEIISKKQVNKDGTPEGATPISDIIG